MAPRIVNKSILLAKFAAYIVAFFGTFGAQALLNLLKAPFVKAPTGSLSDYPDSEVQNIVIVGASFAGYHAARVIASTLPANSPYRVVVVEPHSHFHFTWVFPRFCVVTGHEDKAFIPYGGLLKDVVSQGNQRVKWVQDRVAEVTQKTVVLKHTGIEIPYAFLVVATGSGATDGLPSRVGDDDKASGLHLLQGFQQRVASAQNIVVVGGGAAGVELATDAKEKYPEKHITLVHSRAAVMHRFGPELQDAARRGLEGLGVELILGERAKREEGDGIKAKTVVVLGSGRRIECDLLIECAGQAPSSSVLRILSPSSISPETGKVLVKPTLQIADDALPNVYVCGDVSETGVRNPNARFAYSQAMIAGSNVVLAAQGKTPSKVYKKFWGDGVIKLTLGITKSVTHISDSTAEMLFHGKETHEELMSARAWSQMGVTPYDDPNPEGPEFKCSAAEVAALGRQPSSLPFVSKTVGAEEV